MSLGVQQLEKPPFARRLIGKWHSIETSKFRLSHWIAFTKVYIFQNEGIDKTIVDAAEYNFDHPLALDFDLAYEILQKLKYSNDPVEVPQYCFVEHQRKKEST